MAVKEGNLVGTDAVGLENTLLLASRKDTMPVYWQGANLDDLFLVTGKSGDTFATQGKLLRSLKLVVINFVGTQNDGANPEMAHYRLIAEQLADDPLIQDANITIAWEAKDSGSINTFIDPIVEYTIPAFGTPADEIEAGEVLYLWISLRPAAYGNIYPPAGSGPGFDAFAEQRQEFIDKHPRFGRVKVIVFQEEFPGGDLEAEVWPLIMADQINGTGVYEPLGPGLSEYGWELQTQVTFDPPYVSYTNIRQEVLGFFGV